MKRIGPDHKMCSEVCSDRGLPLAIPGNDGKLYIPTSPAMPGDAQNARLRLFAEQKVTISGKVFAAGGVNVIQITRGASPAKSMNEWPWRAPPRSARSLRPTSRGFEPIGRRVILPSRARYRRLAEAACLCTCSIPPMMLPLRSFSLRC